mmetsp:Transcript_16684/g.25263  ORF Transcript_16684/g.25263 Transcript_16684/m.25263 type:complete len:229 (-) Transcript_16684:10-696(-)
MTCAHLQHIASGQGGVDDGLGQQLPQVSQVALRKVPNHVRQAGRLRNFQQVADILQVEMHAGQIDFLQASQLHEDSEEISPSTSIQATPGNVDNFQGVRSPHPRKARSILRADAILHVQGMHARECSFLGVYPCQGGVRVSAAGCLCQEKTAHVEGLQKADGAQILQKMEREVFGSQSLLLPELRQRERLQAIGRPQRSPKVPRNFKRPTFAAIHVQVDQVVQSTILT